MHCVRLTLSASFLRKAKTQRIHFFHRHDKLSSSIWPGDHVYLPFPDQLITQSYIRSGAKIYVVYIVGALSCFPLIYIFNFRSFEFMHNVYLFKSFKKQSFAPCSRLGHRERPFEAWKMQIRNYFSNLAWIRMADKAGGGPAASDRWATSLAIELVARIAWCAKGNHSPAKLF